MSDTRKRSSQKKIIQKNKKKRLERTASTRRQGGIIFQYQPSGSSAVIRVQRPRIDVENIARTYQANLALLRKHKRRSFLRLKRYRREISGQFKKTTIGGKVIVFSNAIKIRFRNRAGVALFSIGLFLFVFPSLYKASIPVRTMYTNGEPIRVDGSLLGVSSEEHKPVRLAIPKLGIDVSVVEAPVVNGFWELSETSASHGQGSANPGQVGNTVIFAHARDGLFGPIRDAKAGDTVYVFTRERWFKYKVIETKEVLPDQLEVIAPTGDETLTLFTCSGFLDTKRFIVVAKRDKTDLDG